jgi:stress response protein SCP2
MYLAVKCMEDDDFSMNILITNEFLPKTPISPFLDTMSANPEAVAVQLSDMAPSLLASVGKDVEIARSAGADIQFGVSWDFYPGSAKVDLDCSALCFDFCGLLIDACYYNQLDTFGGALTHSGDSLDGETAGFDELVTLDLDAVPANITMVAFVVNANKGGNFSSVETANGQVAEILNADSKKVKPLVTCSIGCGSSSTACIVAVVFRKNGMGGGPWMFRSVGEMCDGKNFQESMPSIRKVIDTFVNPGLLAERQLSMTKSFSMAKGDAVEIPRDLFRGGDDLFIGLGWDAPGGVDLDASVICLKKNGAYYGAVFYGNKKGAGMEHMGDNRTGQGAGDDEKINVDLDNIPAGVTDLYITVTIYSTGATFSNVKNAYVRLCAIKNNHELVRFPLTTKIHKNALVFACLRRSPMGTWQLTALGKPAEGRMATDASLLQSLNLTPAPPSDDAVAGRASGGSGSGDCCVLL